MEATIVVGQAGSWAFTTTAGHPDQLSQEQTSTFFDFEAWDGGDNSPDEFHTSVGRAVQHWHMASPLQQDHQPDFTHLMQDSDLDWTLEQQYMLGQFSGQQSQLPFVEPGLIPFADNQIAGGHVGQDVLLYDPIQELACDSTVMCFNGVPMDVDQQHSEIDVTDEWADIISVPRANSSTGELKTSISLPLGDSQTSVEVQLQPNPTEVTGKKRARISNVAKKILNEHFGINPYPTDVETSDLAGRTQLTGRTIKTWFSNTRSRKKVSDKSHTAVPTQKVSSASLKALEQLSPAASLDSLQRYLAQPTSEEPVHIHKIITASDLLPGPRRKSGDIRQDTQLPKFPPVSMSNLVQSTDRRRSLTRARSVAGSDGSRGSAKSHTSQKSFKSIDSRGSRRGRKLWTRAQAPAAVKSPGPGEFSADTHQSSTPIKARKQSTANASKMASARYYCTWPACDARFRFRWEWARHEGAVHYQPYQWICCLEDTFETPLAHCFVCGQRNTTIKHVAMEHFTSCVNKSRGERTFYRKDQLVQHIKGTHALPDFTLDIAKGSILSSWETELTKDSLMSSQNNYALICGFFGESCKTWQDRQDHVFKHLQAGMCKQSWWPERRPTPRVTRIWTNGFSYRCRNCDKQYPSVSIALREHAECWAWSRRYLHDWHAIYTTHSADAPYPSVTECNLCDFALTGEHHELHWDLEEHADSHNLRSCAQMRFTDLVSFEMYLAIEHAANFETKKRNKSKEQAALHAWKCRQWVRSKPNGPIAITAQVFQKNVLCASKDSPFHDDVHGLLKAL